MDTVYFPIAMSRKKRDPASQEHPDGPLVTVDNSWKDDVRAEMRRKGWDQRTLAEKIPASEGAISNMFKDGPRQIRQSRKDRIEELLGWSRTPRRLEELRERIARRLMYLELDDAERVAGIVDSLATKKPIVEP